MPVHKVEADADGVHIYTDSVTSKERLVTDVQTRLPVVDKDDRSKQAALMAAELQAELDVIQSLDSLESDSPDKAVDPARPDLFWDGLGNLVGRAVTVGVEWNGSIFVPTITRTT